MTQTKPLMLVREINNFLLISYPQLITNIITCSLTDRVCHNCKEPGHFQRECPNPRQAGTHYMDDGDNNGGDGNDCSSEGGGGDDDGNDCSN